MEKIYIERRMWVRGAILGRLVWDGEKVCDTLERIDGCLPKGTYELKFAKCGKHKRLMPFLCSDTITRFSAPEPSVCKRCAEERKKHCFGDTRQLHKIPCGMMQPGNGALNLRYGGIIIGEGHEPGYVTHSQELFLLLFGRLKKNMQRGKRLWVEIR